MAAISRRALARAVAAHCVAITGATGYVGQIGASNGLTVGTPTPADPPTKSADDLRVQPYFILFPNIGAPTGQDSLGGHTDVFVDLDWPIQITAAAGDVDDLLALVDRIHERLFRWAPGATPARGDGTQYAGPLAVPPGYVAPLLVDQQFTPHRFYTPLQYRLTAHT